jgi:8-oxo-dGTP pyrophosphatase MutT (NUDIX family)
MRTKCSKQCRSRWGIVVNYRGSELKLASSIVLTSLMMLHYNVYAYRIIIWYYIGMEKPKPEIKSDPFEKDLYYVAVKLFLRNENKLLITHDIFGDWDLPGGRIRKDEFNKPIESVIQRKVSEELGEQVRYILGDPKIFFRVKRHEHDQNGRLVRIFGIGYDAQYEGGDIKRGKHHDQMEWVDLTSFNPGDYFTGGWLDGVKEYLVK